VQVQRVCVLAPILLLAYFLNESHAQEPIAPEGFTVQLNPPLIEPTYKSQASPPYYLWPFEARVRNKFEFPLRIKEFASLTRVGDGWVSPPEPYGAKEFTEWYTDGDRVDDGWIQPGTTAVDARSWNRSYSPAISGVKWYYVAEDESGNEYRAEQEPDFVPYVPDEPNWESRPTSATASLEVGVWGADGKAPHYAQVRFCRYPGMQPTFAVYETEDGTAQTSVPVPGLYMLEVYAPGHEWTTIPLVLADDPTAAQLSVTLPPRGSTDLATVQFEGAGASAQAAVDFYREWSEARGTFLAARTSYRNEHATVEGFGGDLTELGDRLTALYRDDARPELARFAGLLVFDTPAVFAEDEIDYILGLIPPDSFVWAVAPDRARNAAFRSGRYTEVLEELARRNPDSLVRAEALIGIAHLAKRARDTQRLTELLDQLRSDYAGLSEVAWQLDDLAQAERLVEDGLMPDFDLATLEDGVRVSTTDLKGAYYLLHFWATWCGPCLAEMESVHSAYEVYGPAGLRLVSISLDRKRGAIEKLRALRWPMPWTNVFAGDDPEFEERFGIRAIPALFLVNPDGVIVATTPDLRGEKLEGTLGEYIAR
jgi:thiol-disulfide isomerase/thioredoxin